MCKALLVLLLLAATARPALADDRDGGIWGYLGKYLPLTPLLPFVSDWFDAAGIDGSSNNPLGVTYHFPQPHVKVLDPARLGVCLASATLARAADPYFNPDEMIQLPLGGRSAGPLPLLEYLGAKEGRCCDYATGREGDLRAWVLEQPFASIHPVRLYERSLQLHGGNIWNAVLGIHQLLRNEARWWAANRYEYASSLSAQEQFYDRFIDLRGDLVERGPGFWGDHGGSWYRIWGVVLYRLSFESPADFAGGLSGQSTGMRARARRAARSAFVTTLTASDEYGKGLLGKDADSGKIAIDVAASRTADWLLRALYGQLSVRQAVELRPGCDVGSYVLDAATDEAPQPPYRVQRKRSAPRVSAAAGS